MLVAVGWLAVAALCAVLLLPVGLMALWSFGAEYNRSSYLGAGLLMTAILLVLLAGMGYCVRAAARAVHPRPERVRGWIVIPAGIAAVLLLLYLFMVVRAFVY